MVDKAVLTAFGGAIALMVGVTLLNKPQGPSPTATPSPVPAAVQPQLSDAELFKKYNSMSVAERYPALLKDELAKSAYLRQLGIRVKGDFTKLSKEDQAFADSVTRGHGKEAVESMRVSAKERAASAAK